MSTLPQKKDEDDLTLGSGEKGISPGWKYEFKKLQEKYTALKIKHIDLQTECAGRKKKLDYYWKKSTNMEEKSKALEARSKELEEKSNQLEEKIKVMEETLSVMVQKNAATVEKNRILEELCNDRTQQFHQLTKKNDQLEVANRKLESTCKDYEAQLQINVTELNKINQLELDNRNLEASCKAYAAKLHQVTQLNHLMEQKTTVTPWDWMAYNKLTETTNEINLLKTQLADKIQSEQYLHGKLVEAKVAIEDLQYRLTTEERTGRQKSQEIMELKRGKEQIMSRDKDFVSVTTIKEEIGTPDQSP